MGSEPSDGDETVGGAGSAGLTARGAAAAGTEVDGEAWRFIGGGAEHWSAPCTWKGAVVAHPEHQKRSLSCARFSALAMSFCMGISTLRFGIALHSQLHSYPLTCERRKQKRKFIPHNTYTAAQDPPHVHMHIERSQEPDHTVRFHTSRRHDTASWCC